MTPKDIEIAVAKAMAQQVAQQTATGGNAMQVLQNGGVTQAVNYAVEDFYGASKIIKEVSDNLTLKYADAKPGVKSFLLQQVFRVESSGLILRSLGYQSVLQVLTVLHAEITDYIQSIYEELNKVITEEGEVEKIYERLRAKENEDKS